MDRARALIDLLGLRPHPEGGFFSEVYRSASAVQPDDPRGPRPALTTIYFLLRAGEHSALHVVGSDEAWHHYEGAPLELTWCDAAFGRVTRATLGPAGPDARPVAVVPAGWWQAARPTGDYTLVGCSVGPGFEFADFRMLRPDAAEAALLRRTSPALAPFLAAPQPGA